MIGLLVNNKEKEEIIYLLKKEMDELLYDLHDERISHRMKTGMEERYDILFNLFKRIATPNDCLRYMKKRTDSNKRNMSENE